PEDEVDASAREDSVFSAGFLAELDIDLSLSNDYPEAQLLAETLDDIWVDESWFNDVSNVGSFDLTSQSYTLENFGLDDEPQGL
ncbi:hypothetical protein COL154_013791, partial [Colletotrichum chrysophilum]